MAVHPPLQQAIAGALSTNHTVLVQTVVDELEETAGFRDQLAGWARTALSQLGWLGTPVEPLDGDITNAATIQQQLATASGRPLKHDLEHWGEAMIIAMAHRSQHVTSVLLADDYTARLVAKQRNIDQMHPAKLLHIMIRKGVLTPANAGQMAQAVHAAAPDRGWNFTAHDLQHNRLNRAGQP